MVTSEEETAVRFVLISQLRLDPRNPRLPPEMQDPPKDQREIAIFINRHYDPLRIAASIAEHQFFESEPLIATEAKGVYTVIEGNRRLTALMGLVDPELRLLFTEENKGWDRLPDFDPPTSVPVLIVDNSRDVAPLLGFRHISGIEPWDPYAQARYIATLVDRDGTSIDEVAELVGRARSEVSSKYRDYDILNQADEFGIDTKRARDAFGVFNNAMGRRAIRAYIGAPDPRVVDPSHYPLPEEKLPYLETLLGVIFGGKNGHGRVITDSRQLGQLAQVLAEPSGRALRVLLRTRELGEALDAVSNPNEQFARAIKAARSQLEKAAELEVDEVPDGTSASLRQIARLASQLTARANMGHD